MQLRLLEQRKVVRHALFTRVLKWFALCAVVTSLIWGLLFSSLFKAREFDIQGLQSPGFPVFVDMNALNALTESLSSDSAPSLVWISTGELEAKITAIHGVKSAVVAKVWPGKLVIAIHPREPIAKEGADLVDATGQVLGAFETGMPAYPELQVPSTVKRDALMLLEAINSEPAFLAGIASVHATSRDDIAVTRSDGLNVVFGNTNNLTLKLADLTQILGIDLGGRKTVDLSSPTDPVAK
ncbi:MAG: cell division protein FtsQ/DivIB [Candidatus Ancillula sp.]|nr:cell division protein FtsQ/DivIB [Candidatus Ancillula sp.]